MEIYRIDELNQLPESYGVYHFVDAHDNVMYIGKSLNLKQRIKSYFYTKDHHHKINLMLNYVDRVEIYLTDTHLEALLLEYDEISTLQPNYNKQYKRPRSLVELEFKINSDNFLRWQSFDQQLALEDKIVMPRTRIVQRLSDEFYYYLPLLRVDNLYKIQRNVLPIKLDQISRLEQSNIIRNILSDYSEYLLFKTSLNNYLQDLASQLQFEQAARVRDFMRGLDYFEKWLFIIPSELQDDKIYTLPSIKGEKKVQIRNLTLYEIAPEPRIISSLDNTDKLQITYSELNSYQ